MTLFSRLKTWFTELSRTNNRPLLVIVVFLVYFALLISLHPWVGPAISMVGIIPVLVAAWLYGKWAGIVFALFVYGVGTLISTFLKWDDLFSIFHSDRLFDLTTTILAGFSIGWLGDNTRKRWNEIQHNARILEERQNHARFLTLLNDIILAAMETDDMTTMLKVLARRTGELYNADDCYITRWEEKERKTIPVVAYGALSDNYTSVHRFMADEVTLTEAVMNAGHPIAIEDMETTRYISKNVADEFPNCSALGLPLISGTRKLGAVILGFNQPRQFDPVEIQQGELAARQISLAVFSAIISAGYPAEMNGAWSPASQ